MTDKYFVIYQGINSQAQIDQHDNKESLEEWLNGSYNKLREQYPRSESGCSVLIGTSLVDDWDAKCVIIKGHIVTLSLQQVKTKWVMQEEL